MKKSLLAVLLILVVVLFLVLVRTARHTPHQVASIPRIEIALDEGLIATHLAEAVQIPTVSYGNPDQIEPEAFEEFIAWVATTYPEVSRSMTGTRHGGYTMLYRWAGQNEALAPILLTGHYDVVPVIPGTERLWNHPPFAGQIVDRVIWGRGALDDKSAVIAQLEAATGLLKAGYQPDRTVYFSFGHDEELGGFKGAASVAAYLRSEGVQLAWSLDEGSFLLDGMLPGVEPLLASINVAEKGSLSLEIVATSPGGHSSMPPRQTAVGHLAEAINKLDAHPIPGGLTGLSLEMFDVVSRHMPFGSRIFFANQWLFGDLVEDQLSATTFGNAMIRTTTAATMLSASIKVNVLPIEAIATVNFRLHPRDTVEGVVEFVKSIVENERIEVRQASSFSRPASNVSNSDSAGYKAIERAVREIYGEVIVAPGLMVAGSDSRHYGKVADNSFRFNPMIVGPDDLTGFHGTNEKISVHDLAEATRTYTQIIRHGTSDTSQ